MRWMKTMFLTSMLVLPATSLLAQAKVAQEAPARGTTAETRRAERPNGNADSTIANCLAISNQEEIALAKLAMTHATNPKVKQLAETMINDHQQALTQLKQFGAETVALRTPESPAGQNERAPEVARLDRAARGETKRTAATEANGLDFLQIKREMADKCLQSAAKEWNEKRGDEGDKCFVGSQIVLHQQMLDAQEVLKQHSSPELQAVIDKGIAATQSHLTHAKELMKELESARSTGTNN